MNILLIGGGGREHALAWKLAQSDKVEKVYVAPGNGGTACEEKCENISINNTKELITFAEKKGCFTVVGPEVPLAEGIVDEFRKVGLDIVGPDQKGAQLEASKVFSKNFMEKYGVHTGHARTFKSFDAASGYAKDHWKHVQRDAILPLVVKADGLAAGKGVVVAHSLQESIEALEDMMERDSLGKAGHEVLLEEFLDGRELSVMAAVDGKTILPFVSARDHKARFENGQGPNTGGMGAIAPVADFDANLRKDFELHILKPTLDGIRAEGFDYRGFLYFGLMIHNDKAYLLEYNVRLGDPETQALLPLMQSDLVDLCQAILDQKLSSFDLQWKPGAVCAPVVVSSGYPGLYNKGKVVTVNRDLLNESNCKLFAAGLEERDGQLYTSGGRVLAVAATGGNPGEARERAYRGIKAVSFEGMAYRTDIGL
jgi:phosphoribosylamine--glycine ligase